MYIMSEEGEPPHPVSFTEGLLYWITSFIIPSGMLAAILELSHTKAQDYPGYRHSFRSIGFDAYFSWQMYLHVTDESKSFLLELLSIVEAVYCFMQLYALINIELLILTAKIYRTIDNR